jgi:hypothetical protein
MRQRTLARLLQAPTAARAGKQGRRGDLRPRRTVNPVEMRTFGEQEDSLIMRLDLLRGAAARLAHALGDRLSESDTIIDRRGAATV